MIHHSSNDIHSGKSTNDIQWYSAVQYANIVALSLVRYTMVRKHHGSQPSLSTNDIQGSISKDRPEYVRSMQTSCLASDSTCVAQVLSGFIAMAHSLGNTSKKDDVGKPVAVAVEDAADRGFRKRKFERGRVELRKMGF